MRVARAMRIVINQQKLPHFLFFLFLCAFSKAGRNRDTREVRFVFGMWDMGNRAQITQHWGDLHRGRRRVASRILSGVHRHVEDF